MSCGEKYRVYDLKVSIMLFKLWVCHSFKAHNNLTRYDFVSDTKDRTLVNPLHLEEIIKNIQNKTNEKKKSKLAYDRSEKHTHAKPSLSHVVLYQVVDCFVSFFGRIRKKTIG